MKMFPKKGGHGHVTSYTVTIGTAEARRAGFVGEDGKSYELEKVVDEQAGTITIKRAAEKTEQCE